LTCARAIEKEQDIIKTMNIEVKLLIKNVRVM